MNQSPARNLSGGAFGLYIFTTFTRILRKNLSPTAKSPKRRMVESFSTD